MSPGLFRSLLAKYRSLLTIVTAKLDVATSTRASSSDLASLAAQVATILGRTDVATSTRGGGIKRIIQGEIHTTSGAWTTFDLSSYGLNYAKTIIYPLGSSISSTYGDPGCALVVNASLQRIESYSTAYNGQQVRFQVVEYE